MLSKALLSLLLAAPALASPVAQLDDSDAESFADLPPASALWSHEVQQLYSEIPTSIVDVLVTAVPATWYENLLTNEAAASSVYENAVSGVYPDWYSKLPGSVQAWVTSEDSDAQSALATETALASSIYSSLTADASSAAATITSGSSSSSAKTTGSSSGTSTGTDSAEGSSSASASASASPSSTSNGAAPMATGNVAFSVAGAVGLLGLAVAL